jgi:hypothetical protein
VDVSLTPLLRTGDADNAKRLAVLAAQRYPGSGSGASGPGSLCRGLTYEASNVEDAYGG